MNRQQRNTAFSAVVLMTVLFADARQRTQGRRLRRLFRLRQMWMSRPQGQSSGTGVTGAWEYLPHRHGFRHWFWVIPAR